MISEEEAKEEAKVLIITNKIAMILEEEECSISVASCVILCLVSMTSRVIGDEKSRVTYIETIIECLNSLMKRCDKT